MKKNAQKPTVRHLIVSTVEWSKCYPPMTHEEKNVLCRSLGDDWETPVLDDFLNAKKLRLPGFIPNETYWASGSGSNRGNALAVDICTMNNYVWNSNTERLCVRFVRREIVGRLSK